MKQIIANFGLSLDNIHPILGDLNALLAKWIKQGFLEKTKVGVAGSNEDYIYSWGSRAAMEFPVEKISKFIAKIYGTSESESILKYIKRTLLKESQ